MMNVSVLE